MPHSNENTSKIYIEKHRFCRAAFWFPIISAVVLALYERLSDLLRKCFESPIKPHLDNIFLRTDVLVLFFLLTVGILFSQLIPPFQSPDEFDHIKRSYMLSKGYIILDAPEGQSSGGMIDVGLAAYINAYSVLPFHPDRKLTKKEVASAAKIKWEGERVFSPAPGTGYYFPFIYLPQAVGLWIGETTGRTVDFSYKLARLISVFVIVALLALSFRLYPVNPLTLAMLVLPMSIFQFSSASLDGIAMALSVFTISAFLRITAERENISKWIIITFSVAVMLLITSRVHLLSLLCLLAAGWVYTKKQEALWGLCLALFSAVLWTVVAIETTVDNRVATVASTPTILWFYLEHPLCLMKVMWRTITDGNLIRFYGESFIGILGWLDARFSSKVYAILSASIALIAILSISAKNIKRDWRIRILLVVSALMSIFLVFFALLITWTPHPAEVVQGVQGRYFLIPAMMLAYAISGGIYLEKGKVRKIALVFVALLSALSVHWTVQLVVERYYLAL